MSISFWTTRLFNGMPTYLISMQYNDILVSKLDKVFMLFTSSYGIYFLLFAGFIFDESNEIRYMGCYYAALAFTLSSYFIIILQVGHTSSIFIGYGSLSGVCYFDLSKKYKWGLYYALFLALNISNHLQVILFSNDYSFCSYLFHNSVY